MKAKNYTARDAWMLGGSGTTGGADGEARFCTSLSTAYFTNTSLNRKAAALYARACRWVELNPATWRDWHTEVAQAVAAGRLWSVRELAERSRRGAGHVTTEGGDFEINNSLLPALARMLCEVVPGALRFTELRASVFEAAASEPRHG